MSYRKQAFSVFTPIILLLLALVQPAWAGESSGPLTSAWDASLKKYVSNNGLVNYKAWKSDRQPLDSYIQALGKITSQEYKSMSRNQQLALWINAYNAFTVKLVLDHYPIKRSGINFYPTNSIRQINGVWDKYQLLIGGRKVTLSEIENKILRKDFNEPLIHFAINCASKSCPKLKASAYSGDRIRKQLGQATRSFIADRTKNRFDVKEKRIELSSIFQWYKDDFISQISSKKTIPGRSLADTAIIKFLLKYTDDAAKTMISSNDFSLSYLSYDWSLNERKKLKSE